MNRSLFLIILIPALYFPCYISNDLLIRLTVEDGVYQNAGAIFFLLAAIAFFILAIRPEYYAAYQNTQKYPERKYFCLFALILFFAFGEEISWGQRIFNFATPEAVKAINIQEEFNVHNLEFFHGNTREGEEKTGIMALFTMSRLFYIACLTYLLVLPFLYKINAQIRNVINKINIPVPNIIIGIFFAFNLIYANMLKKLFSELDGHGIVEIKEFVTALILITLPLSWLSYKKTRDNLPN